MPSIDDVMAECFNDPAAMAALDKARIQLEQKRKEMGDEAFRRWIAGHFIGIERKECEECAIEQNLKIECQVCGIPQNSVTSMLLFDGTCVRCGHNLECHSPSPATQIRINLCKTK